MLQSSRHLEAFVIAAILLPWTTAAYAQFPGNAYGFEGFRAREWRAYASIDEMTEALQIPPKVLKSMSTRDLIASCLNYPLMMEVYLTDSLQQNMEAQRKRFNGLRELVSRPDAADELARYYVGVDLDGLLERQGAEANELARKGKQAFQVGFLELLLSRREVLEQASENSIRLLVTKSMSNLERKADKKEIHGFTGLYTSAILLTGLASKGTRGLMDDATRDQLSRLLSQHGYLIDDPRTTAVSCTNVDNWPYNCDEYPYYLILIPYPGMDKYQATSISTPNGSPVPDSWVLTGSDLTEAQKQAIHRHQDTYYACGAYLDYPLRQATASYNCHGYAWHMFPSTSNPVWIGGFSDKAEDVYWQDGSYVATSSSDPNVSRVGYIGDHSAVKMAGSSMYMSKWGRWAVMRHDPLCVPQGYGYPNAYYKRAGQQYASFSAADEAGLARVEVSPSGDIVKPAAYALEGAYPNPLHDQATIRFALPEATDVELIVYDALGRAVARLVDGRLEAGRHEAVFEAGALPSGIYVYELRAGSFGETGRLVLAR